MCFYGKLYSAIALPKLPAFLLMFAILSFAVTILPATQAQQTTAHTVGIVYPDPRDARFAPAYLKINLGDAVIWRNSGEAVHILMSGFVPNPDGLFHSGTISPGETFTHTFGKAGKYQYFDQLDPFMVGEIEVVGSTGILIEPVKQYYVKGETATIMGQVSPFSGEEGRQVLMQVYNPDNAAYRLDLVTPKLDGSFTYSVAIGGELGASGNYRVTATYGDSFAQTRFNFSAVSTQPLAMLKVNAIDQNGSTLYMWVMAGIQPGPTGSFLASYTPTNLILDKGKSYYVTISDYLDSKFSRWEDGSTSRTRLVDLSGDATAITAYFQSGASLRGFSPLTYAEPEKALTVNAIDQDGRPLHMWTRIERIAIAGDEITYKATVHDYSGLRLYVFDHWEDGSTDRARVMTIGENTTITAHYKRIW